MAGTPAERLDVAAIRARFSSLRQRFAFLDAPGGSQVPDEVGDAIAAALREASANIGAVYPTSLRVKEILERSAHIELNVGVVIHGHDRPLDKVIAVVDAGRNGRASLDFAARVA